MNRFGQLYSVTTFGESHGEAVGGIIDGMPSGVKIDLKEVQNELNRRRPGQSGIVTSRQEKDRLRILSGLFEETTTGTPIGFLVENENQRSSDYNNLKEVFRPSHADFTYTAKYGIRDHRGGGRASARETISRVVAGAFAKQALAASGIRIYAYTSQVGNISLSDDYTQYDLSQTEQNDIRCPDTGKAQEMHELIERVRREGDTIGGVITCIVKGAEAGLGEPVFDKLHARLAYAMLGINAAKGFEYGCGFSGSRKRGSEINDRFFSDNGTIRTRTNHSGGIQGGISNGEDIYFRIAFKPVATLQQDVETVDCHGNRVILHAKGRHDPCVLPRAVPIVEAMTAIVLFDMYLLNKSSRL